MPSSLFNRFIEFKIETLDARTATTLLHTTTFNQNRILVNLSKGIEIDTDNTGQVTVVNVPHNNANLFTSSTTPYSLLYNLTAGYEGNIGLISRGFITETNWSHDGGETKLDFFISEGSKIVVNPYGFLKDRLIKLPANSDARSFLSSIENLGQQFDYIPDKATVLRLLSSVKINKSQIVTGNFQKKLKTLLDQIDYTYFVNNTVITLRPKTTVNVKNFLVNDPKTQVLMNFNSGLLSANLENGMDYQHNTSVSWLKFNSLFIPELLPANVIVMNEPSYPHLEGEYRIWSVTYSLNNKDGGFTASGEALHKDFVNPATGLTTEQTFSRAGLL